MIAYYARRRLSRGRAISGVFAWRRNFRFIYKSLICDSSKTADTLASTGVSAVKKIWKLIIYIWQGSEPIVRSLNLPSRLFMLFTPEKRPKCVGKTLIDTDSRPFGETAPSWKLNQLFPGLWSVIDADNLGGEDKQELLLKSSRDFVFYDFSRLHALRSVSESFTEQNPSKSDKLRFE